MARLIYSASETNADLLYVTRFMAPDPFLWFETDLEQGVILSPLEIGRGHKVVPKSIKLYSTEDIKQKWNYPEVTTAQDQICALAQYTGITEWEVPETFPLGLAEACKKKGLNFIPVKAMFPERIRKNNDEVEAIRHGVKLCEKGFFKGRKILEESIIQPDSQLMWQGEILTAEILRGQIDAEIALYGGTASHTITAPGIQGSDPHLAGTGPILAGQPIVLDIFPRVDKTGYFGDFTRTLLKGEAPEIVQKAFNAVKEGQETALEMAAPGIAVKDIHNKILEIFASYGFETDMTSNPPRGFFHGTGHGLGLEIHEDPRVSHKSEHILEIGNVVTIEPGLYYPEWGGIRLEDVICITEDGCENLTDCPKELVVE